MNKYLYVFVHIPKNAGASFMKDSPKHLPRGAILRGSHEKALWHGYTQHLVQSYPRTRLVLMLRHPIKMAYSQFLMCKYSIRVQDKGFPRQGTGVKAGLTSWAQRLLEPKRDLRLGMLPLARYPDAIFATAQSAWTVPKHPPMLSKALASLGKAYFVGLAEAYPQSACLLRMLTTSHREEYCRCGSTELGPRLTHERHKVPSANLKDLDKEELQLLAKLVPRDVRLYARAIVKLDAQRLKVDKLFGQGAGAAPSPTNYAKGSATRCGARPSTDGETAPIPAKYGRAGGKTPAARAYRGVRRWERASGSLGARGAQVLCSTVQITTGDAERFILKRTDVHVLEARTLRDEAGRARGSGLAFLSPIARFTPRLFFFFGTRIRACSLSLSTPFFRISSSNNFMTGNSGSNSCT